MPLSVPIALALSVAAAAPVRGGVEVDTSAVGEEGPALRKRIDARAKELLLAAEVMPAREPGDAKIRVAVTPAAGEDPGWTAMVTLDGAAPRTVACNLCTEGELIDKVAVELEVLIPQMGEATPDPEAPPPGPDPEPPRGPTDRPAEIAKIGALGVAGIAVGVVGLAGVGAGIGLLAKGKPPLAGDPSQRKNYVAPGGAVLAVGAAALVAGVALLVVDRTRRERERTALLPTLAPGHVGLSLQGRF